MEGRPIRVLPFLALAAAVPALAQSGGPERALEPVARDALPPFARDDVDRASLRRAIAENRRVLAKRPGKKVSLGGIATTTDELRSTLELVDSLLDLPADRFAAAVASELVCYRSRGSDGQGKVLFTAYHSPCFEGSRRRTERCRFPLRRAPKDLKKPFFTRREIEGKLDGRGLEIAWFARRLDAYLMEVQGSGTVKLEDGAILRLQCTGSNGHPYTSLGRELAKDKKIPEAEVSIPAIRAYFDAHPEDMDEYLFRNASTIFFEETNDPPRGCAGTFVTPLRSIATDKHVFPAGALGFVVVPLPVVEGGKVVRWEKRFRFVVDDDTGAFKGPGRVDLYLGDDEAAEVGAGVERKEGELYYLLRPSGRSSSDRRSP